MRGAGLLIIIALVVGSADLAAAEIHDCDRLAANPPDPDRVTTGVERKDVDIAASIMACQEAVAAAPDEARFSYQLGRVLFYDGQTQASLKAFRRAIELNYR